jgi:hypothetical protein
MNFVKYQHIQKLGTPDVEGILVGLCYLTYKIDGANGCLFLGDDGKVAAGGRTRILSEKDDGDGMFALTKDLRFSKLFADHPNWIVYGEWLTPHTLRRYKADAWRKFYVFDVLAVDGNEAEVDDNGVILNGDYIPLDVYAPIMEGYGISCIPLLAKLENPTEADIKAALQKTGDWLLDHGLGEGVVIKNYGYRNPWGRRVWAKMLTEDFYGHKKELRNENHAQKDEHPVEHGIVTKFLTPEAISKEFLKFKDEKGGWELSMIPEFLGRFWHEWIGDNIVIILNKLKTPTIDFKALQSIVFAEVKAVILPDAESKKPEEKK